MSNDRVRNCNVFAKRVVPLYLDHVGFHEDAQWLRDFDDITPEDLGKKRPLFGATRRLMDIDDALYALQKRENDGVKREVYVGYMFYLPEEARHFFSEIRWQFLPSKVGVNLYKVLLSANTLMALRTGYEMNHIKLVETAETALEWF